MKNTEPRVRQIAYLLALGINQLVDKGYTEPIDTMIDKMLNMELIEYVTSKYKNDSISEFDFTPLSLEKIPAFNELLYNYGSVLPLKSFDYYGISNNGLVLTSSVLLHILKEEL